jgi:UDP-N-acetyl-D-mannosaminuronic acid transferase (WecB/TagA/CpsF family)
MVGVGAAFDLFSGRAARAPAWMGDHGLEWLFRLTTEPRRLWKRYILQGGGFAVSLLTEVVTGGFRRRNFACK